MGNSFGTVFCLTTFGESHGPLLGAVVDGCPPRIDVREADIQAQLDRRRPGQSGITTPRNEADRVRIVSGVQDGLALGTPITILIDNNDQRPRDYEDQASIPRPSHADFTYRQKYGITARSGGGRASARETVARVAGGAVAETFLRQTHNTDIVAWVSAVGPIDAPDMTERLLKRSDVDKAPVRCPDASAADEMISLIEDVRDSGDSVGGVITCVCRNIPAGWGEPVFDKMEARLAAAMLSIPASKTFDVGDGAAGCRMRGSEHNDLFVKKGDTLGTQTNRSGGIQAGITNGEPIVFRVGFKPTATIASAQMTVDYDGNPVELTLKGRHDPCVVPRAVPIVEAMAALVLADMALLAR